MTLLKYETEEAVKEFLEGPRRNLWISLSKANLFVRKSVRVFDPDQGQVPCIDIASVEVEQPYWNQGVLGSILDGTIESARLCDTVTHLYVENMLNPYVRQALVRRGFTVLESSDQCAYLLLKEV